MSHLELNMWVPQTQLNTVVYEKLLLASRNLLGLLDVCKCPTQVRHCMCTTWRSLAGGSNKNTRGNGAFAVQAGNQKGYQQKRCPKQQTVRNQGWTGHQNSRVAWSGLYMSARWHMSTSSTVPVFHPFVLWKKFLESFAVIAKPVTTPSLFPNTVAFRVASQKAVPKFFEFAEKRYDITIPKDLWMESEEMLSWNISQIPTKPSPHLVYPKLLRLLHFPQKRFSNH